MVAGPRNHRQQGLADAGAADPFALPRLRPGIGPASLSGNVKVKVGPPTPTSLLTQILQAAAAVKPHVLMRPMSGPAQQYTARQIFAAVSLVGPLVEF